MPRHRKNKNPYRRTNVEIEHPNVVMELCAKLGITLRDYINLLIREDIAVNRGEHFSNRYFKGI